MAESTKKSIIDLSKKGSRLFRKGQLDQARNAYNIALASMDPTSRNRNFIQMKIEIIIILFICFA